MVKFTIQTLSGFRNGFKASCIQNPYWIHQITLLILVFGTVSLPHSSFAQSKGPCTPPSATGVSICPGGSGSLSSSTVCTSPTTTTITGAWNTATDPIAFRHFSSTNSTLCDFTTTNRSYVATSFQVTTTGNYVFTMSNSSLYDGMGYIYTGPFVPGSCATGTYIRSDDDSEPTGDEPQLGGTNEAGAMTLTAGVTYTLISTTFGASANNSFVWTITGDGSLMINTSTPTIEWYTASSGGSAIGTGATFNPVGVAGSGLANTNTPGTTTYYAACSSDPTCRTPVNFVINMPVTPSVSIAANPGNTISPGTNVTFTATPTNGGSTPSYQWKKNNADVGSNSTTYMDAGLINGDIITCVMTSNADCASPASATSNSITMTIVTSGCLLNFGTPSVTNVQCAGGNTGRVVLTTTGGVGAITYSISPNVGSQSPAGTFNNLTAQTYTFTATDANNCSRTTTATVGTNTNLPPTITLTSPSNGATITSNMTITANASDPENNLTGVNFYLVVGTTKTGSTARSLLGSDNSAPYSFDWANIAGGTYTVQAEAVDACNSVFSSTATVNVLETFTVLINSPTTGQGFMSGSNMTIGASVTGFTNRTITKVEFFYNNIKLGEDLTAPYSQLWTNVPAGNFALQAVATDNLGGVWRSPLTYILGINGGTNTGLFNRNTSAAFNLSPNPTSSQLNVNTTIEEEGEYELYIINALGRTVLSKQMAYQKGIFTETLDVSILPKGLYIVRLANASSKFASVQKLIVD